VGLQYINYWHVNRYSIDFANQALFGGPRLNLGTQTDERCANVVRQSSSTDQPTARLDPLLLEKLMAPEFYPHKCMTVERLQTQTSWILFAGDFVYKLKKPVYYDFVDARTPAKRYRICRKEIRLNRRLAPKLYIGVAGILANRGAYSLVQNAGLQEPGVLEFAIVMHRLPDDRMLGEMLASRRLGVVEIKQLAENLAAFHRKCSIAKAKTWGSAPVLSRLIAATISAAEASIADTVMRYRLAAAARYMRAYLITHQPLIDRRVRTGRVREGHGALRLGSLCLTQAIAVVGGIEHNEQLRYCDVASELASVMIELEIAGRNELSDALLETYVGAADDDELNQVIPLYKCFRAVRRGQLEMLISFQTEMPRERRMLARHYASQWFQFAEEIARTARLA